MVPTLRYLSEGKQPSGTVVEDLMGWELPHLPNPLDYVPDLPSLPNPLDYVPDIPALPNPLDLIPKVPNPLDHIPSLPRMGNPLDYLPNIPNPLGEVFDDAVKKGEKAGKIVKAVTQGETNTGPNPAVAREHEDLKAKYQAQAYKSLGIDEATFSTMDPIQRNALINASYAKMYKKDPEIYKWAGMAAMASDKAGTGMMQTYMLEGAGAVPGGETVAGGVGAPDGEKVRALLAQGNAGIFNDMMWQHMAFDTGGIAEMEKAFKEGSIKKEQLDGWRKLADSKEALQKAQGTNDPAELKKAQEGIWAGNKDLLKEEQGFVQDLIYDESPESRKAFQFLSSGWNVMGVTSPVPGGKKFNEHRKGKAGAADVGDFDQRWKWIEDDMLPEYQTFEADPKKMGSEMDKYIGREKKNQWNEKAWDPLADQVDKAVNPKHSPLINPFHGLF